MTEHFDKGGQAYLQFGGRRIPVKIAAVSRDTVAVSMPGADYPDEGTGVDLNCHDAHGVASYHMEVAVALQQEGDILILRRASSVTPTQRRRSWRVPVDGPAEVRMRDESRPAQAAMVNISAEGALIETDAALEPGDPIELCLALPERPPHAMRCRVIRTEPDARSAALWFIGMSPAARHALTCFIWRRLQELQPEKTAALFPGSRGHRQMVEQQQRTTDPSP